MARKTDIRWSDTEWAALEAYAAGMLPAASPGRAVKYVVTRFLCEEGFMARAEAGEIGSAAPREREPAGVAAPGTGRADALGSGGGLGTGPASASSRPVVPDLMAALKESLDRERRPEGSAGSSVPVPPADGSAAGALGPVVEPAGVRLLDAVSSALRAQGMVTGVELVARKAIRSGQVVVDGEACTDPERLVDPGALDR